MEAQSLGSLFSDARPELVEQPISDFSGFRYSAATFCRVSPRRTEAVGRILQRAHEEGIPVRTRAQGHSLNGSSLPEAGELCLSTANLRGVRFEEPGTVTAGSGVVLWVLQYVLRQQGYDLPVLNDGYPGPSVGGYLAAGGFGPRSAVFGGFWDNVLEVALVDGRGALRRFTREDALFPWLFGAMGQLGVIVEAKLAVIAREGVVDPPYPFGTRLVAPQFAAPKIPAEFSPEGDERLFWFTLFTPDEHLEEAHTELKALEKRHAGALRFQERYRYPIRYRGRVAPLVYPAARAFTATGAWGWLTLAGAQGLARLLEFDREFMELAASRPHYRRYMQSELPSGPQTARRCLGEAAYGRLRELKAELDPRSLLNRGSVFA